METYSHLTDDEFLRLAEGRAVTPFEVALVDRLREAFENTESIDELRGQANEECNKADDRATAAESELEEWLQWASEPPLYDEGEEVYKEWLAERPK